MALSGDKLSKESMGHFRVLPLKTGEKIYAGALVAVDANGYAIPGATAANIRGIGVASEQVDNSDGADGAITVTVNVGVFVMKNSGTDPVTAANIRTDCYIVDDETVSATDGTGTQSVAGKVHDISADGTVWVDFR